MSPHMDIVPIAVSTIISELHLGFRSRLQMFTLFLQTGFWNHGQQLHHLSQLRVQTELGFRLSDSYPNVPSTTLWMGHRDPRFPLVSLFIFSCFELKCFNLPFKVSLSSDYKSNACVLDKVKVAPSLHLPNPGYISMRTKLLKKIKAGFSLYKWLATSFLI